MTTKEICHQITDRFEKIHIGQFPNVSRPLLLISEQYPGVWMEHLYDSVFYAKMDPSKLFLAENIVNEFIDHQTEEGQLPCYIFDASRVSCPQYEIVGRFQIQEVVSFGRICWETYGLNKSRDFLEKVYEATKRWVLWLKTYRMTTNRGLVEMFCGYDTGHDESARLRGFSCPGNYVKDGIIQNAGILPPEDGITPVLAVDMNCNFYGNLSCLSKMAQELGNEEEAFLWTQEAKAVKERLFALCFCDEDCYFYDVDKKGNQRKFKSSTLFHLFIEKVLDPVEDKELIQKLYTKHLANPQEFATPYPYPSMAYNDPSTEGHPTRNCWGYYTQGLIALRSTLWLEEYGFTKEFDYLCAQWVKAWTEHYDHFKLGQEIDPITGVPTDSSEWYSSTMLFYLYAAKRLGLWD